VHENGVSNIEPRDLARLVSASMIGRYIWHDNLPVGVCILNILMNE
jgi:hypothetical protein